MTLRWRPTLRRAAARTKASRAPRPFKFACAALVAVFAATGLALADPIEIAATPLALGEGGDPVTRVGELDFLDGLELTSPDRRFGELSGRELGRLEAPLTVDNFEGLAVRRDALGRTLIYLVSDDNFKPYQRTLVMQFRLAE